jgi:hypothetical protein
VIAPDSAAGLRAERRFDLVAAVLIGAIAILAAVLSVVQISSSQGANRADLESARLAADLSARIAVSGEAVDSAGGLQQAALMVGMEAVAREEAGLQYSDPGSSAVGAAEQSAYKKLQAELADTSATTGGAPVDPYTAGLLNATTQQLIAEVREQNHQVDLANAASLSEQLAVLGLSFLALSGVLTGLAAVLRESRGGRIALSAACLMAGAAGLLAILAFL